MTAEFRFNVIEIHAIDGRRTMPATAGSIWKWASRWPGLPPD
ncbi:hypothetical protein OKW38_005544 [Paraburkholderia sp. MM5496-R1]